MSLDAFLVWDAPRGTRWQLVNGEPRAMALSRPVHGVIQSELNALIGNHLQAQGASCVVAANPGIRIERNADFNYRIPDLGVTCSPLIPGEAMLPNPILLVEILSPSNSEETWTNVWAYTTIPSVREVLIVRSDVAGAQLLRRGADGAWPAVPQVIDFGDIELESIGLHFALNAVYAGTWLAQPR